MSKEEELIYKYDVELDTMYIIKVRIGDGQSGDHNVFGTCPFATAPIENNPEWKSELGQGSDIKGKKLFVSSATQNNNPQTNQVSVRVFINDIQIEPEQGNYSFPVKENEVVYFNQQIDFV